LFFNRSDACQELILIIGLSYISETFKEAAYVNAVQGLPLAALPIQYFLKIDNLQDPVKGLQAQTLPQRHRLPKY
jgi:hypothetical protein